MLDTWVPILIVETDLRDICWMLFREEFGLAEDEPKLEDLQVVQMHGRPPMKIYAKYSVLRRKLLELGLDEQKLPFVP